MATKKKSKNYLEQKEPDSMKVAEPVVSYGNNFTLNLGETKRYTYADLYIDFITY